MLFGLSLVVALIAVHRGAGPAVAAGAISAGVAMIHGEGMPRHTDAGPVIGVMALGTLPRPVICRLVAAMAGLAIRSALVAESCAAPARGVMAVRALPAVVVSWLVAAVAGLAVGLARMTEGCAAPAVGIVTVRALPAEVIGGLVAAVAGLAVGLTRMAEGCTAPTVGIVAVRALPTVVVGGLILLWQDGQSVKPVWLNLALCQLLVLWQFEHCPL